MMITTERERERERRETNFFDQVRRVLLFFPPPLTLKEKDNLRTQSPTSPASTAFFCASGGHPNLLRRHSAAPLLHPNPT